MTAEGNKRQSAQGLDQGKIRAEGDPVTTTEPIQNIQSGIQGDSLIQRLLKENASLRAELKRETEINSITEKIILIVDNYSTDLEKYILKLEEYSDLITQIHQYTPETIYPKLKKTFEFLRQPHNGVLQEKKDYLAGIQARYDKLKKAFGIITNPHQSYINIEEKDKIIQILILLGIITEKKDILTQDGKLDKEKLKKLGVFKDPQIIIPSIPELQSKLETIIETQAPCGCLLGELGKATPRDPISEEAEVIMAIAEKQNRKEEKLRKEQIKLILEKLGVKNKDKEHLIEEIFNKAKLQAYFVAQKLEEYNIRITPLNQENFIDLLKLLGLDNISNGYLTMAERRIETLKQLQIDKTWFGIIGHDTGNEVGIAALANKANEILQEQEISISETAEKLSTYQDFKQFLKDIRLRRNQPITFEKYKNLMDALLKIQVMHTINSIKLNVGEEHVNHLTSHITQVLKLYTATTKDGKTVLFSKPELDFSQVNSDDLDSENDNYVVVASINIGNPKTLSSMVIKMLKKDSDFTKDFMPEDIKDILRFSVILAPAENDDLRQYRKDTKKIIAILMALFGTDIPQKRLRDGLVSGKSNESSTGKHRAFHFTMYPSIACRSNRGSKDYLNSQSMEIQVVMPMNEEKEKKDHALYKRQQKIAIKRWFGLNFTSYENVLTALMSRILFAPESPIHIGRSRYSHKEEEAIILFRGILELINTESYIFEDPNLINMLRKIVDRYKDEKYLAFAWQINKIQSIKELDMKRAIYDIDKELKAENITKEKRKYLKVDKEQMEKELEKERENTLPHKQIYFPKHSYNKSALYNLANKLDQALVIFE